MSKNKIRLVAEFGEGESYARNNRFRCYVVDGETGREVELCMVSKFSFSAPSDGLTKLTLEILGPAIDVTVPIEDVEAHFAALLNEGEDKGVTLPDLGEPPA